MGPIRVFALSQGGYEIDDIKLAALAARQDLKDLEVVVISVAGRFREGKSFILNFILKYLKHVSEGNTGDWLKEDDTLEGFEWRNSLDRVTTGIQIWDEVFKIRRNDKEVAVLVMDTQGVFDTESSVEEATAIFAFSVLTSSMQVYNLMQNIKGDDLPNLAFFVQYGLLAANANSDTATKAFQELVFLIRDFQSPHQFPFGWDGGAQLLQRPVIKGSDKMKSIQKSFNQVRCYPMPHPGMTVATSPNFEGKISDVDKKFLIHARHLVSGLLAPENLVTKKIEGRQIVFSDFCLYVQAYADALMSDDMPTPKGLFEATQEANNESVRVKAVAIYAEAMKIALPGSGTFIEWPELSSRHLANKERALQYITRAHTMGGERVVRTLRRVVENDIDSRYNEIAQKNEVAQLLKLLLENEMKEAYLRKLLEDKVSRTNEANEKLEKELKQTKLETGRLRSSLETLTVQLKEVTAAAKKRCCIQ